MATLDRLVLSDAQWARMSGLVSGRPETPGSTGRDNRLFVEAVLWVVRTGAPWRDLPEVFGHWNTAFRRFSRPRSAPPIAASRTDRESDGDERRVGPHLRGPVRRSGLRVPDRGQHHRARSPTRGGRQRGAQSQAIGRSRGGLSSKLHLAVRGLGCPVRFVITAGQAGDAPQAQALLEGSPAEVVIADAAYDADHIRAAIAAKGAQAVIPSNPSRTRRLPLDTHLYKARHLVECCFSRLKQFRRVATRYEKTARNDRAVVTLAAIALWLR